MTKFHLIKHLSLEDCASNGTPMNKNVTMPKMQKIAFGYTFDILLFLFCGFVCLLVGCFYEVSFPFLRARDSSLIFISVKQRALSFGGKTDASLFSVSERIDPLLSFPS